MSARNPFTIIAQAAQRRIPRMKTQKHCVYPSWRQIVRPFVLGTIGLAIAVVLWGFGYKLSLYHRHASPSPPIPVAKLWIESRNASASAVSRLKDKSHLVPGAQAFSGSHERLPRLDLAFAFLLPACARRLACFYSLIPFRSPPPHRFCLA